MRIRRASAVRRPVSAVVWVVLTVQLHAGCCLVDAAATKAADAADTAPPPKNQKAPFRHRNLDYWDGDTLAAYLSISPTYPHTAITEGSSSSSNNNDTYITDDSPVYAGNDAAVLFYAQWCNNCHALAPVYDQIATLVHAGTTKTNVVMALFDCEHNDSHKTLCSAAGITHYPTLMYIGKGKYHDTDPVTATLVGENRSAGRMGKSAFPYTVKFQGDWRYGDQIMDWIGMMKGLSSWQKWMEGHHSTSHGGLLAKLARFLLRPFVPNKNRNRDGTSGGVTDNQPNMLPVGVPPQVKIHQALHADFAKTTTTTDSTTTTSSSSASVQKLQQEVTKLTDEKKIYKDASAHSGFLIDALLFYPSSIEDPITQESKTLDIYAQLYPRWDEYANMGDKINDPNADWTISTQQSCVADMTLDFCSRLKIRKALEKYDLDALYLDKDSAKEEDYKKKLADIEVRTTEAYCAMAENCMTQKFATEECRPKTCPFQNDMGCRYVNTCLDPDVINEYEKIYADAIEKVQQKTSTTTAEATSTTATDKNTKKVGGWGLK